MKTQLLTEKELNRAVELIQQGEIVAFPTDTVYGLGADATNQSAVKKIYQAKGRPADRPINVLIGRPEDILTYALDVTADAIKLAQAFWPGPFTLILNNAGIFASSITAGKDTIGLRMPDNPLALEFIEKCGVPLATPSANSSGRPSPTLAQHVLDDLHGKVAAIIDGGPTAYGIESTILDFSDPARPILLRPGSISKEAIEAVIQREVFENKPANEEAYDSDKHYEPKIPVYIVKSDWETAIQKCSARNETVALLADQTVIAAFKNRVSETFLLGAEDDVQAANRHLFEGLRTLEQTDATVILAQSYSKGSLSVPYMNRLEHAANKKTI